MFTQVQGNGLADLSQRDIWRYVELEGVSAIELVPSLVWGTSWQIEQGPHLDELPPIATVQSLLFGVPMLLSRGPLDGKSRLLWDERLGRISELSRCVPDAVFVLGAPAMRLLGDRTEAQALGNFRGHVKELADAIECDGRLALENCGSHQGADFCIGLEAAALMVGQVGSVRVGINLDLEAALAEGLGRLPASRVWDTAQSAGAVVHSIQVGTSVLGSNRDWVENVLALGLRQGTVRSVAIEDTRFRDWRSIQSAVSIVRQALS